MLFNKKHQKKIQMAWAIVSIVIIISMILLYSPSFRTPQAPVNAVPTGN